MSLEFRVQSKNRKSMNYQLRTDNSFGMTIAEAVIAIAISAIVGSLLIAIIVNSSGIFYKESSTLQEGLNINDSLSKVRETIKESNGVSSSYVSGGTTYTSGAEQLVLKVPALDVSGNIIQQTFDFFVFFKDQKNLRLKIFPDATSKRLAQDQIFTTSLDSLKFQYFNSATPPAEVLPSSASKVKITLTLKIRNGLKFETQTATSEAYLRND